MRERGALPPLRNPYARTRISVSNPDGCSPHSGHMNAESLFALLIAAAVAAYLVYALLRPERF